jgi:hypothetical protein
MLNLMLNPIAPLDAGDGVGVNAGRSGPAVSFVVTRLE